ncbi:MAG: hypothetical protein DRG11_05305 [Epsilonproteobacteria bacterium]|nr:MAG: hypothetical protein DRG11_05305 [Campylobacterota bacterium]
MNGKKWIKIWFILIFIIGVIPYSLLYIYLESNFENNTYSDIVERQITNNSIYGTALNQNTFSYKLELIKKVKPNIVALGSSRVMAFRKENFNTSFVTAGGGMNYLNEGYKFLENMYQFHKPEYIILGLDFWWFNNDFNQPKYFPYHENDGKSISTTKIYKTLSWLTSGKVSLSSFTNILNSNKIKNQYTNYDNLGFAAISTSNGFRSDGSQFYSKTVFGLEKSGDEKFSNTFKRISDGNSRFEYGNELSKDRIDTFNKILEIIKNNNTKIILLIPPIANATYKKMEAFPYGFIDRFRELVKSLDMENYDYHNLSVITQNDCECVDGFHGGDVVYSRIIKDIYDKNSSISKYIDIANVNNSINLYQGNALIVNSNNIFRNQEVDFLQLGCIKQKNKLNTP